MLNGEKRYLDIDFDALRKCELFSDDVLQSIENDDKEIEEIVEKINSFDIDTIPFEKKDFWLIFFAAVCEIVADTFVTNPTDPNTLSYKCNHKGNAIGDFLNDIHESIDHRNNPLDFQGLMNEDGDTIIRGSRHTHGCNEISFGGGNHRARTFGHDLLMFVFAIYMYHVGQFYDGGYINIDGNSVFKFVQTSINQNGKAYDQLDLLHSIFAYATHMFADFFSSKGLPIPGWSLLTHAPVRDIRKWAVDVYDNGMNLRTLILQGLPVVIGEILVRTYTFLQYKNCEYSQKMIQNKQNKILLFVHGLTTMFEAGKIYYTGDFYSINYPLVMRSIYLVYQVVKDEVMIVDGCIEKINWDVLKLHLEAHKTIIMLEHGINCASEKNNLIHGAEREFKKNNDMRASNNDKQIAELDSLLQKIKNINAKGVL